jgi:hypothetical protein
VVAAGVRLDPLGAGGAQLAAHGVLGLEPVRRVHTDGVREVATAGRVDQRPVLGKGERPGPLLGVPLRLTDGGRVRQPAGGVVVIGGDLDRLPAVEPL